MSAQRVLRLRRADKKDDSFVLLHVVQSGDNPLDLKLSASESEYAYIATSRSPATPHAALFIKSFIFPSFLRGLH